MGCLLAADAASLNPVAQDGMRVRASAGAASFRRADTLERCLGEAQEQVKRLAKEREHPDPGVTKRQQAAREREARVAQAREYLPQAQAAKERQQRTLAKGGRAKVTEPRVSTTDPEARVMKQPDGGFRPALNLELATDTAHQIVVGVAVTNAGTDWGQAAPLEAQVAQRLGRHPDAYLLDGGLASFDDLTLLAGRGVGNDLGNGAATAQDFGFLDAGADDVSRGARHANCRDEYRREQDQQLASAGQLLHDVAK